MIFGPVGRVRKIDFGTQELRSFRAFEFWLRRVTLTKMNWTVSASPCESRRVIARGKTTRRSTATHEGIAPVKTLRKRAVVIAFPAFEHYGDQILGWLSTLGDQDPTHSDVARVTRSLRRAVDRVERVRNSPRHTNMACLMRHTLEALRASEWNGARYLLMTAHVLMNARVVGTGARFYSSGDVPAVFQFPAPEMLAELTTEEAITGIVTG
jgi:hypothetical protein